MPKKKKRELHIVEELDQHSNESSSSSTRITTTTKESEQRTEILECTPVEETIVEEKQDAAETLATGLASSESDTYITTANEK